MSKRNKLKPKFIMPEKPEIRKIAAKKGIVLSFYTNKNGKMVQRRKKIKQLIKEIQAAEGNPQCFKCGCKDCSRIECTWFASCQR